MTKKSLIWVYPPNNWKSNFNRTFVYGWSTPKAKLFAGALHATPLRRIKIFPNGNFAQTIKLPHKKNIVHLIQILNGKRKIISRNVIARKGFSPDEAIPIVLRKLNRDCHAPPTKWAGLAKGGSLCSARNDTVIVIDPGHGGREHGTHTPKGVPEKYFNLQIAKLLYKKLTLCRRSVACNAPTGGIYLTRSNDKFVSLKKRINFARKKKADIFISIHHNALPDNEDPLKYRGIGIYYTHDFVKPFCKKLLENISKASGLKKYGLFKRDFAVTRSGFYAGVLIECGFLIHPVESEYITKRRVQKKFVEGIVKGLSLYTG